MDKLECNRNIKILEIGPGYGLMSYVIMKLYPNASMHWVLLGTEQRPLASIGYERGLKKVKDEFSDRITYTFGRIELDDDLLCEKYDVVIMTEVFEHFAIRPVETMQKLRTALKPDGMMFLTTPNWGHLPTFTSWEKLVTKDEITEERYNELLQCGHVYQYNKVEMDDILNRAGWRVEEYAVSDGNNHNYLLKSQG